ncbi:hypothetical protein ACOME3_003402 [Neoechinorhynchus agilis]
MGRTVFVTVGTTNFPKLTNLISSDSSFTKLLINDLGFSRLIIQYGNVHEFKEPLARFSKCYQNSSIKEYLDGADLIISHAGAGSVIEALESKCKRVIVVVNEDLMNNHQCELADKAQSLGYLKWTSCRGLVDSIRAVMDDGKCFEVFEKADESIFRNFVKKLFEYVFSDSDPIPTRIRQLSYMDLFNKNLLKSLYLMLLL